MTTLRRISLIVSLVAAMPAIALAAKDSTSNNSYGWYYTFPFEFPHIDYGPLNNLLNRYGYPECRRADIIIGAGLQIRVNRSIFCFTYNSTRRRPDNDSIELTVRYRSFALSWGYNVLRHPNLALYPFIGFKSASTSYICNRKVSDSTPTSFGQYLQTPLDHKELRNGLIHFDIGAGCSFQSFWLADVRVGALVPLAPVRWTVNKSHDLQDVPAVRYQYYISITLGLGDFYSERLMRRHHLQRPALLETRITMLR